MDNLGFDIWNQSKTSGNGEKGTTETVRAEHRHQQATKKFGEACIRTGTNKVLRMGVVPGRVLGSKAFGMAPSWRKKLRRQFACVAGQKPTVSLSLFLEINKLGIDHELACAATCYGR